MPHISKDGATQSARVQARVPELRGVAMGRWAAHPVFHPQLSSQQGPFGKASLEREQDCHPSREETVILRTHTARRRNARHFRPTRWFWRKVSQGRSLYVLADSRSRSGRSLRTRQRALLVPATVRRSCRPWRCRDKLHENLKLVNPNLRIRRAASPA